MLNYTRRIQGYALIESFKRFLREEIENTNERSLKYCRLFLFYWILNRILFSSQGIFLYHFDVERAHHPHKHKSACREVYKMGAAR
jgi:hypothetical protein